MTEDTPNQGPKDSQPKDANRAQDPRRPAARSTPRPPPSPHEVEGAWQLNPGARPLADYQLLYLLGKGGFSEVWKATGPGGYLVALKFVRLADRGSSAELRALDLMKDIRHPHLLGLFGAWKQDDRLIIAMELGDRTLMDRLKEAQRQGLPGIPRHELLEYMSEAARGIDHLNNLNIQHRDIKPQNLLLVGTGVKVADFGLAKLLENSSASNTVAITPAYAAPEFLQGGTCPQSDQYALAVTYCHLRGGRMPFSGEPMQVLTGHLQQPPDLTMLPEAERAIVGRALAKNPAERWPNCRAFVDALRKPASGSFPSLEPRSARSIPTTPSPRVRPRTPTPSPGLLRGVTNWLLRKFGWGKNEQLPSGAVPSTSPERQHETPPQRSRPATLPLPSEPGQPPAGESGTPRAGVRRWHLHWEAPRATPVVGEPMELRILLGQSPRSESLPLEVPASTFELTAYVEAPGFRLEGEHIRTVPVIGGVPTEEGLSIRLLPLLSGEQTVRVLVHAGGGVDRSRPAELVKTAQVASANNLESGTWTARVVRELIDRREVPDPQPDVLLHVTREQTAEGSQLRYHLTCSALGLDGERLDPPLPLSDRDFSGLRRVAAAMATGLVWDSSKLGGPLFHKVLPATHRLRELLGRILERAAEKEPLSWLVVSDAEALLPWEMVSLWGGEDEFLGDNFALGHWVGRRGLNLRAEAPLGLVALTADGRERGEMLDWQMALGGEGQQIPPRAFAEPGSPFHGLHVVRFSGPTEADPDTHREDGAAALLRGHRLGFTLKRPVVGLSFVGDRPAREAAREAGQEAGLEATWVLPLLHAGASAVVGPRWPVLPAADLLFVRAFYEAMRGGAVLGQAVWQARRRVRRAYPRRTDWLAYAFFGHPECRPSPVRAAQGYAFFEALSQPEGEPFRVGQTYRFRASYRAEPPAWYGGRLCARQEPLRREDISVLVAPLMTEAQPRTYALEAVPGREGYQRVLTVTIPEAEATLPVLVRFQRGPEELQTLFVELEVSAGVSS
jgi:serine/threonine protein kinase